MSLSKLPEQGISGRLAAAFLASPLTPLLALTGILLGLLAITVTPREEDPQIEATMANVFIPFPGATAKEVEEVVTIPVEQTISELNGVKHIASVSRPGMAIVVVEFHVGQDQTQAIVRLNDALQSKDIASWQQLGVGQPTVRIKDINDVPIVTLTLWSQDPTHTAFDLDRVANSLEGELQRIEGIRKIGIIGAPERVVHIQPDIHKLAAYGLVPSDLQAILNDYNAFSYAGAIVNNHIEIPVEIGQFLSEAETIRNLIVQVTEGQLVKLRDVAEVSLGAAYPTRYVRMGTVGSAAGDHAAVTLTIAKKPGSSAIAIAETVIERIHGLRGILIPDAVQVEVTRNYGVTADDKVHTLIKKLVFATGVVVALIWLTLGLRAAIVVGATIAITLCLTLYASWAWGFTFNRVSLFALIFAIGILVDDAIVVMENIHRNQHGGTEGSVRQTIVMAVDEIGPPTILATFTVILALLPMAFVSGLMGPYMSPIPINASIGMLISLAVAFVFTPWMAFKLRGRQTPHPTPDTAHTGNRLTQFLIAPVVGLIRPGTQGWLNRRLLFLGVLLAVVGSLSLAVTQAVILKMLPFDNKANFQIVVDLPEGTPLEQTYALLTDIGAYLATQPEVANYQLYAGLAAPDNFNGLVRQYDLRQSANTGDINVNLVANTARHESSHALVKRLREPIQNLGKPYQASIKLVEVPPGPPVLSPLVAEIYGVDPSKRLEAATEVSQIFATTPGVVDVDTSLETQAKRLVIRIDHAKAATLEVSQRSIVDTAATLMAGGTLGYLHSESSRKPIPIRLELPLADKASLQALLQTKVKNRSGAMLPIADFIHLEEAAYQPSIYHKDLRTVIFVTGDVVGSTDSPLYGMYDLAVRIGDTLPWLQQNLLGAHDESALTRLHWDGEWRITYETFRDMGIAYAVGLMLIYLLLVAQFNSYFTPVIVMAPMPLTIIGVLPGHALLGAAFTATSMIGMIALAGIIVRNSILLVDFINQKLAIDPHKLDAAVIESVQQRARPIILTGLSAILGGLFILDDPIFNGLAVSLIFGILVSTLLTLVLIPVWYHRHLVHTRPMLYGAITPAVESAEAVVPELEMLEAMLDEATFQRISHHIRTAGLPEAPIIKELVTRLQIEDLDPYQLLEDTLSDMRTGRFKPSTKDTRAKRPV